MNFDPRIMEIVKANMHGLKFEDVEWAVADSKDRAHYYHRYFALWVPFDYRRLSFDGADSDDQFRIRADLLLQYMLHIRLTS